MPTHDECICCHEIQEIVSKRHEVALVGLETPCCITDHPGFEAVALNMWNLQAVYYAYRQQYGPMNQHSPNE